MRGNGIERLSFKDLLSLKTRIEHQIAIRRDEERMAVRKQILELVADAGFTIREVMGKNRTHVLPKYRDPKHPERTWSGRGRQPKWMKESGKAATAFLIA